MDERSRQQLANIASMPFIHHHVAAGIVYRKDKGVIDEIPGAYKDIDVVMENQKDLTEILHTLKQVVCVKG